MRLPRVAVSALAVATIIVAARCAPIKSQPRQVQADNAVTSGQPVIEFARPDSLVLPYGGVVEVTVHRVRCAGTGVGHLDATEEERSKFHLHTLILNGFS